MNAESHSINKLKNLLLIGSFLSAMIALLCCIGPIVLALLGVGGAGLFSKFASIRPFIIGITVIFLGTAFYLTFRKGKIRCGDGACKIRSASKFKKIVLLVASIPVVFFLALPYLLKSSNQSQFVNQTKDEISEVIIPVEGMSCSGCEFNVEDAIKKLDGILHVKANHKSGEVHVKFLRGKVKVVHLMEKINKTGYKAVKPQDLRF